MSQPKPHLIRMQREVGTGGPGYRWAPGYLVVRNDGAQEYPPRSYNEAVARLRELGYRGPVEIR
jgi:hypothetical protein